MITSPTTQSCLTAALPGDLLPMAAAFSKPPQNYYTFASDYGNWSYTGTASAARDLG
jgi:hypothetical protein